MYARDVSDRARRPAIVVSDLGSSELENWTAEDQGLSDARNAFIGPPPSVAARGGRPRSRILELGSWMLGLGRIVRHSLSDAHDEGSDEAFRLITGAVRRIRGYLPPLGARPLSPPHCVGTRNAELGMRRSPDTWLSPPLGLGPTHTRHSERGMRNSSVHSMAAFESSFVEMLLAEVQKHLSTGGVPEALESLSLECQPCAEPTAPDGLTGTRAALAAVEKEASLLGLQLHPLRSLDELAAVLETQLVFPEGTPRRARRMLEELRLRGVNLSTEFELTQLIERLEASDGWAAALGKLRVPSERRVVLVPPVMRCVVHHAADLGLYTTAVEAAEVYARAAASAHTGEGAGSSNSDRGSPGAVEAEDAPTPPRALPYAAS